MCKYLVKSHFAVLDFIIYLRVKSYLRIDSQKGFKSAFLVN